MANLQAFWRFMLEMIFPAFCLGCGREGDFLCLKCLTKFDRLREQVCPLCYDKNLTGSVCDICKVHCPDFFLDGLMAFSRYEDKSLLARAIHLLKYDFVRDLAAPLAGLLAGLFTEFPILRDFVVCPVPLHKKRLRWRGFNQAELMAECIKVKTGLPVKQLLERTQFSKPQMELEKVARGKNVANAFRTLDVEIPPYVLLLDDVATTLSTLNACAKALKQAGAARVFGIVLARVY